MKGNYPLWTSRRRGGKMPCVSGDGRTDIVYQLFDDLLPSGKGYIVMLKVFLDRAEKRDPTDCVLCVVATVFKPTPYKQFVRPWERLLKRWDASAFHATDFYNGAGEFKRNTTAREGWFKEDCREIPNIIGQTVERVLAVGFRPDEFIARAPREWKDNFGTDTHAIAAQLCLVLNGRWLENKRSTESFAYVQETDPHDGKVEEAVRRLRHKPEYAKIVRIVSFATVEKGAARGLEASDFVGWHWNKHYMDKVRKGESLPRKDFAAFINLTEKRDKVQTAFVTGDNLSLFFDTLERTISEKLQRKLEHANAKGETTQ